MRASSQAEAPMGDGLGIFEELKVTVGLGQRG